MEVKLEIANLASVPEQNREEFCNLIQMPVTRIWRADRRVLGTEAGGALIRAAKAARALHEAFANLNPDDRAWVEKSFAITPYKHWFRLPSAVLGLATVFNLAVGKAMPIDNRGPHQRGRRPGTVKHVAFLDFVRWLITVTEEWCGGELTYDKNYEDKSTLLEAINILTPYLPKGVVPKSLPSMQRIKSIQSYSTGFGDIDLYDE